MDIQDLIQSCQLHDLSGLALQIRDLQVPTASPHAIVQQEQGGEAHAGNRREVRAVHDQTYEAIVDAVADLIGELRGVVVVDCAINLEHRDAVGMCFKNRVHDWDSVGDLFPHDLHCNEVLNINKPQWSS